MLFRYKLEPRDRDWQDAGNRRQAYYTDLAPGHYRFRVIAANNSGVWNEAGDALDFDIPPAWYQAMWFRALCLLAFCTLLWAIYQMRVHQLQEQEKKFREAVETMPALAFLADSNSDRTFLNRGWLEYTGLRLEEALGSGWMRVIHPDDYDKTARQRDGPRHLQIHRGIASASQYRPCRGLLVLIRPSGRIQFGLSRP